MKEVKRFAIESKSGILVQGSFHTKTPVAMEMTLNKNNTYAISSKLIQLFTM